MTDPQHTPPAGAWQMASSKPVVGFLAGLFTVIAAACWYYRGVGYFIGAVIVGALVLYGVVRSGRRSTKR